MNHESITTMGELSAPRSPASTNPKSPADTTGSSGAALLNSANGQNVVLNNVKTETGQTYWYELLPQILFNRLVDHYPDTPHAADIMPGKSADRWYEAYQSLKARPGGLNFDHTAFSLTKMEPTDNGKWHEPDGAEAMAFVFFSAYRKFGDEKYLTAAKDLVSFTDQRPTNPHYEILHLYGAYLAARMNAEYDDMNLDVAKSINWCLNPARTARVGASASDGGAISNAQASPAECRTAADTRSFSTPTCSAAASCRPCDTTNASRTASASGC